MQTWHNRCLSLVPFSGGIPLFRYMLFTIFKIPIKQHPALRQPTCWNRKVTLTRSAWYEPKPASRCYPVVCDILAILIPGIASPCAKLAIFLNGIWPDSLVWRLPVRLWLVRRHAYKLNCVFPYERKNCCNQTFLQCWQSAVLIGLAMQDYKMESHFR